MQNQEVTQKMNNSEWMVTLERVEELRQLFLEVQSGEILFWLDGDWYYRGDGDISSKGVPSPHLILSKKDFERINEKNIENFIFNTMRLLNFYKLYITYSSHKISSLEGYLRLEENSNIPTTLYETIHDSLCHSYDFYIYTGKTKFSYTVDWNDNGKDIKVVIDNSIYGYTNFYDLTMFLLDQSRTIKDYKLYTQFCMELRNFQNYYYKTISEPNGELYTSETEVKLLNPEFRLKYFDPKVNSYSYPPVKIADIIDYFDIDIVITDEKLLERYINTNYLYTEFGYYELFNNITVSNVKALVLGTIQGIYEEPSVI